MNTNPNQPMAEAVTVALQEPEIEKVEAIPGSEYVKGTAEEIIETVESLAAQQEAERRGKRLVDAFQNGKLTWEQFKVLPKNIRNAYEREHGKPTPPHKLAQQAKKRAKSIRKRTLVKQSKRRNRR